MILSKCVANLSFKNKYGSDTCRNAYLIHNKNLPNSR